MTRRRVARAGDIHESGRERESNVRVTRDVVMYYFCVEYDTSGYYYYAQTEGTHAMYYCCVEYDTSVYYYAKQRARAQFYFVCP